MRDELWRQWMVHPKNWTSLTALTQPRRHPTAGECRCVQRTTNEWCSSPTVSSALGHPIARGFSSSITGWPRRLGPRVQILARTRHLWLRDHSTQCSRAQTASIDQSCTAFDKIPEFLLHSRNRTLRKRKRKGVPNGHEKQTTEDSTPA